MGLFQIWLTGQHIFLLILRGIMSMKLISKFSMLSVFITLTLTLAGCSDGGGGVVGGGADIETRVSLSGSLATSAGGAKPSIMRSVRAVSSDFDSTMPPRDIWAILIIDTSGNYCGIVADRDGSFSFDTATEGCDDTILLENNKIMIAFVKVSLTAGEAEVVMLEDSATGNPMLITLTADIDFGKVLLAAAGAFAEGEVKGTVTLTKEDASSYDKDGDGVITESDATQLQLEAAIADPTNDDFLILNTSDFFGAPGTWYIDQGEYSLEDHWSICNTYKSLVADNATGDINYEPGLDIDCYDNNSHPVAVTETANELRVTVPLKVKGPDGQDVTARKSVALIYKAIQTADANDDATEQRYINNFYQAWSNGYLDGTQMTTNAGGVFDTPYSSVTLTTPPAGFSMSMGAWGHSQYVFLDTISGKLLQGELEEDSDGVKNVDWYGFALPLQMKEKTPIALNEIRTQNYWDEVLQSEVVLTIQANQTVIVRMVRDANGNPRTIQEQGKVLTSGSLSRVPVIKVQLTLDSISVTNAAGDVVPQNEWPIWLTENYPPVGGSQCFYILSKYGIDGDAASCTSDSDWATSFSKYRFGEISYDNTTDAFTMIEHTPTTIGGIANTVASTLPDALSATTVDVLGISVPKITNPAGAEIATWIEYIALNFKQMDFLWQANDSGVDMGAYAWVEWPNDGTSPLDPDPWNDITQTETTLFAGTNQAVFIDTGKFHISAPTGTNVDVTLELRSWNNNLASDVVIANDDFVQQHIGDGTEVTSLVPSATFDLSGIQSSYFDTFGSTSSALNIWEYWDCTSICTSSPAMWASVWVVVKDSADASIIYTEQWIDGYVIRDISALPQ